MTLTILGVKACQLRTFRCPVFDRFNLSRNVSMSAMAALFHSLVIRLSYPVRSNRIVVACKGAALLARRAALLPEGSQHLKRQRKQIGRASCRERVCQDVEISVVAV